MIKKLFKERIKALKSHLIYLVACRGLVMPGVNCLIVCPPPKLSSTQECDKYRRLDYVNASVEKKISKK